MARILCGYSGIEFQVEHMPVYLTSRESHHPIFDVSQKKLISIAGRWSSGSLTNTESYLVYLALLNSTDLIDFRVPAVYAGYLSDQIVSSNMESLIHIIGKVNLIKVPSFVLPRFVISPDTKNLSNTMHWIEVWHQNFEEFMNGYRSQELRESLKVREESLHRLIKSADRHMPTYLRQLGDWAASAGSFPTFEVATHIGKISCGEYWKHIIRTCYSDSGIFSIPRSDIEECLEHCEDNIAVGSIYSNAVFAALRTGLKKQSEFLGLGDFSLVGGYTILDDDTPSPESVAKAAIIASAPSTKPVASNYPSKLAYLKAKVAYDMAVSQGASHNV